MASLQTIFRQVEREGAKWGLYAKIRDGKVKVCARVAMLPLREIGPKIVDYVDEVIASLDETSSMDAWSAVLRKRLTRHSGDIFKKAIAAQADEKAKEQEALNARRRDFRAFIKRSSNRVFSVCGFNPDGTTWAKR